MVKAPVNTDVSKTGTASPPVHELEREALEHVWIHQTPWIELAENDGMRVFEKGEGIYLYDVRGRKFIDGISGLWVVNAGHGRHEIADAMAEQARKLAYASAAAYTTVPAVELAAKIAEKTPGDLSRVFFSSGGSEAVETAIKIAKQVQAMRGFARRYKIIARRGSYHGMTHGAMSLTATRNENHFGPFMYGVSHVPHPNRYNSDFGVEGEQADIMAAKYVEQEIISQGPDTVAAVIAEPISSAAGVHVPSKVYWTMLRDICDRHGVLLIADEVINGWGRTGKYFAMEHYGVTPDIMTMAKGLSSGYAPIAATVVRPSVFEVFQNNKEAYLGHLLTFGGHPVAAAAAIKNIEIFENEQLPERAAEMGEYLMARLEELRAHPTVGDVRGVGLLTGVEVVKNKETKESFGRGHKFTERVTQLLDERGLITRVWAVAHIAPPLTVTKDEIDTMVTMLDEALTIAEGEYAGEITS
jgi:adenosylmethionine-8-amino-7-oxononanoate aminotransferase